MNTSNRKNNMTDTASLAAFYDRSAAIDGPLPDASDLVGVAAWHGAQADYYAGGIEVESANLAVSADRLMRSNLRRLIKHYRALAAFHGGVQRHINQLGLG